MKLTNNRLYLDYNATAPLDDAVLEWLSKGVFPFGNPSSIHNSGKQSKKLINQTRDFLFDQFELHDHSLFFHSGATEGINDIVKGFCYKSLALKEEFHVIVSRSDHSCLVNQKDHVELMGGSFHFFDVNSDGNFNEDSLVDFIKGLNGRVFLNYTYINNETGVVWELDRALRIKEKTNCFIHVDAVQLIGKWKSLKLSSKLDGYTFSGHKFGAMKGVGFSFVSANNDFTCSLIRGGGQQEALRSGTENVLSIYSIKLALESLMKAYDYERLKSKKERIENALIERYSDRIEIAGKNSLRNANTIYLIIKGVKTDILITAFDMAMIDVSSGSACSSGAIKPSRVLLSMGYTEEDAKNSLRLSFSPSLDDENQLIEKLTTVLDRFLS